MTSLPSPSPADMFLAEAPLREVEEYVLELANRPEGWVAVGAVLLLALLVTSVVWMYRHEGRIGASLRTRTLLSILRGLVLIGLAIVLLEPVRVKIIRRWIDSYALVLVDESASMDIADAYPNEADAARVAALIEDVGKTSLRRRELASGVLHTDDRAFLRDLIRNNRVKIFGFGEETSLHASLPSQAEQRHRADSPPSASGTDATVESVKLAFDGVGKSTNVERAVRRAVESVGSAPIAGVVVLSDGGFNTGALVDEVARFARDRRVPIHCLGIGDPSEPRNVRIVQLDAPETAFQQDPVAISVELAAEGLDGQTIRVELREQIGSESGESRLVDSRNVQVALGGGVPEIRFERKPGAVGRYVYTVEAPAVPAESVTDDNARQAAVNVIDARTRVLLVSGAASWEYRFVATLLQRDATFDLSCWLQSADLNAVRDGATPIDHLPTSPEELFTYDAIILMDPDHRDIGEEWTRLVDNWVTEHGGGLLMTAARKYTPALMREPALKALRDLLPVTLDPEADLVLNRVGHYQLTGLPMEIPQASLAHPVMQMSADPASTRLDWQGIGDIHWHYPVLREKPAATVLLRHADPRMKNAYGGHVLLATQYVGAGRAGFLAFDGTWRWRKYSEELFNRFWVQLVRHVAEGKRLGGAKNAALLTDGEEFPIGEAVTVTARLLNARFEPLRQDQVVARFSIGGDVGEFILSAKRDQPGWFDGRFVPNRTGTCKISLTLPADAAGPSRPLESRELQRDIRIVRPNVEVRHPQMDRVKLQALAEGSFGGRYFDIDQAAAIPAAIPDLHEEIPIRSRPESLWDRSTTLWLLVALLSIEWAVRKWKHLL